MRLLAPALSFLGTAAVVASAADTDSHVVPGAYIVEFEADQDPAALYAELAPEGIEVDARVDLRFRLFKGASFQLRNVTGTDEDDAKARRVLEKPNVKAVWPVKTIRFPQPETVSLWNGTLDAEGANPGLRRRAGADVFEPHVLTQVDKLRAAGFTGKGIKIGIVDTGVDYKHPALGGCFGPGCLVGYGYDLVGDKYNGASSTPVPDPDPYAACGGHGTHVAGIIAAQATNATDRLGFTGAAPGVTLGMYRTSGCAEYTTNELLLAGFNMAYEDGSDIISCSAGDDSGWANDPWAVMASRIVEAGVPVVVALGNSGDLGVWQVASPASGAAVTAAGSVDNSVRPTLVKAASYTIGTGAETALGWLDGTPEFPNITLPVLAFSNETAACQALPDGTPDLSASLVLLPLTTGCSTSSQVANLVAKGGKYVLFYSQKDSDFNGNKVYFDSNIGLAGVGLTTLGEAKPLIDAVRNNTSVSIVITAALSAPLGVINLANEQSGGHMSTFSSWGPTFETVLKPQFSTPGGNILSTYPLPSGGYAVLSGTSMATPLAAAILALVAEARGTKDPATLNSAVAATARRTTWYDGSAVNDSLIAPAVQQGAGLAQAYDAARTPALLSVTSLSFNDTDHSGPQTFAVRNVGDRALALALGHVPAATVYTLRDNGDGTTRRYTFPNPIVDGAAAALTFSPTGPVSVPAGGRVEITVSAAPPQNVNATLVPVYSGYVTLADASANVSLSLPYVGVAARLGQTPVVQPGFSGGTYLTTTDGHFNIPAESNRTFTLPRPGRNTTSRSVIYPKVFVRPTLGSPLLRIDLVSPGGGTPAGLNTTDVLGRPSLGLLPTTPWRYVAAVGASAVFTGTLADGTVVPAGRYQAVVSAVRVFGDAAKAADWTVVETAPFVLAYLE